MCSVEFSRTQIEPPREWFEPFLLGFIPEYFIKGSIVEFSTVFNSRTQARVNDDGSTLYTILWKQFVFLLYQTISHLTMKLLFFAFFFSYLSTSLGLDCGEPCTDFAYEQGGLHVCSSPDYSDVRNTSSGECLVSLKAKLKVVSHFDLFVTFGVAEVVRRNIGARCWDNAPRDVAKTIIADPENFNVVSVCRTNPDNSPSLEKEVGYSMVVTGYSDCSSLVILHQNFLAECVKNKKTLRGFASVMYIITMVLCVLIFIGLCVMVWFLVEKCIRVCNTPDRIHSPPGSPSEPVVSDEPGAPGAYPVSPQGIHDDMFDLQSV